MAIVNPGKSRLLWLVRNPLVDLDYGALCGYVHDVLGPYAPGLTVADCLPAVWGKGVHPVFFAPTRCHSEGVNDETLALSSVGGWATQSGFEFRPSWIYCDKVMGGFGGDRLYRRVTRVICHEVCHCFGVGHSADPKDVMYPQALDTPYTVSSLTGRILNIYLR